MPAKLSANPVCYPDFADSTPPPIIFRLLRQSENFRWIALQRSRDAHGVINST